MKKAPVVFLQYLTALSIVEGIAKYGDGGYENLDVRLKWPNDICELLLFFISLVAEEGGGWRE